MTYHVPFLSVTGPNDLDMLQVWGSRLVGVRVVSRFIDGSDTCTFTFRNGPPYVQAPAENTPFTVKFGWSEADAALFGTFYMRSTHLSGDPKQGEQVAFECFSSPMVGLDQSDSRHFNAENGHNTLGDVFRSLGQTAGMGVDVAATIAGLPIPGGHLVQWNQSIADFATDLANDHGAIVKPIDGRLLVLDRNSGQSVSGKQLVGVVIDHAQCSDYDVMVEPRYQVQSVSVPYMDDATGRLKTALSSPSGDGAKAGVPHPAADQASAEVQSKARTNEFRRFTATGLFIVPGDPNGWAGCKPKCIGFPDPIDAIQWIAAEVTHDVEPDAGWWTTYETETDPVDDAEAAQ